MPSTKDTGSDRRAPKTSKSSATAKTSGTSATKSTQKAAGSKSTAKPAETKSATKSSAKAAQKVPAAKSTETPATKKAAPSTAKSATKHAAHKTAAKSGCDGGAGCRCGGHGDHREKEASPQTKHPARIDAKHTRQGSVMTPERWQYVAVACFIVAGLTALYVIAGLVNGGRQPADATQQGSTQGIGQPSAQAPAGAVAGQPSTTDPASALLAQKCGGSCHQPSRLTAAGLDRQSAAAAVDKMVKAGRTSVTAQERDSIVSALTQR